MQIDMAALRLVEAEKGISTASLLETVEEALLKAYRNQSGAVEHARVSVDAKTGEVLVLATEVDAGEAVNQACGCPNAKGENAEEDEGYGTQKQQRQFSEPYPQRR